MRFCVCILLVFLTGCRIGGGDQRGDQNASLANGGPPPVPAPPPAPVINIPKAEVVDMTGLKADIRNELQSSANSTQNQMSGLLNAQVSKIAERMTGVESTVSANATATAKLEATLQSTISMNNTLSAELKIRNEISAKMEAQLHADVQLIKDLNVKIGSLESKIDSMAQGAANAQVGWNNKFEQLQQSVTSTAGRDVNQLPREAVYMILGIISIICGVGTTIGTLALKNMRRRELETNNLLMKALAMSDPNKARELLPTFGNS